MQSARLRSEQYAQNSGSALPPPERGRRTGSVPWLYGKWFGVELTAENKKMFYIPEGFAHGFVVLTDEAEFAYKCTDFYHPGDEGGVLWSDPEIGIDWPIPEGVEPILSEKDKKWLGLKDTFHFE